LQNRKDRSGSRPARPACSVCVPYRCADASIDRVVPLRDGRALIRRAIGSDLFKQKRPLSAFRQYEKAITALLSLPETKELARELSIAADMDRLRAARRAGKVAEPIASGAEFVAQSAGVDRRVVALERERDSLLVLNYVNAAAYVPRATVPLAPPHTRHARTASCVGSSLRPPAPLLCRPLSRTGVSCQ
jgi:hypothetical protein